MIDDLNVIWGSPAVRVEDDEVRHFLILEAQEGSEAATLALVRHYIGPLRGTLRRFQLPADDARQIALLALLRAVEAYGTPGQRRGHLDRLNSLLLDACWGMVGGDRAVPIGGRTLRRYRAAVRRADGRMATAVQLAKQYGVSPETFRLIQANERPASLDEVDRRQRVLPGAEPAPPRMELQINGSWTELADEDTRTLVELALLVLPEPVRRTVEYSFGFVDGAPHTEDETAEHLNRSPRMVRAHRARGLELMRRALGVEVAV